MPQPDTGSLFQIMKIAHCFAHGFFIFACAAAIGCTGRGKVLISGTITDYVHGRDSIFVSLTQNWESIRLAPSRFGMRPDGSFELEFSVGKNPPPASFIKNNTLYARLMLKSLWDPSPVIIDDVRNKIFDVQVKENGLFVAQVEL